MTIVQNGTLVTPGGMMQADLAMEDGKITAIAPGLPAQGAVRVDASGCWVFPGFLDGHTHLDLNNGEINTISTDHCSFRFADQKTFGRDDFTKIPNGAPGVEHRPALMFSSFGGVLNAMQLCDLLSTNAAKLFGMYPRKGALAVGSDADVVVWDPGAQWTITAQNQHQAVDCPPYEGFATTGRAKYVFVNGILAAENGEPSRVCAGRYVAR